MPDRARHSPPYVHRNLEVTSPPTRRRKRNGMSTLYTTLWMITQAYAVPLGYYGSVDACQSAANGLAIPQTAQVLCVPSDTAMPLDYRSPPQTAESQAGAPSAPSVAANVANVSQEGVPFIVDANAPLVMADWF